MSALSPAFQGSIPEYYDRYLRPLLFEPYALDMAARLQLKAKMRVLELACGTGILTRALVGTVPGDATVVATDLSEQMLALAQRQVSPDERLAWQTADATSLPFDDRSVDAILCQFGIMFFPDKERSLREARRVLADGGQLLVSTWQSLEKNPIARLTHEALGNAFPAHPPRFLDIPYGMYDEDRLGALVLAAGFSSAQVQAVTHDGHSPSPRDAAAAFVKGTPLAVELAEYGISLDDAVAAVERAVEAEFGGGEIQAPLNAIVVNARA